MTILKVFQLLAIEILPFLNIIVCFVDLSVTFAESVSH